MEVSVIQTAISPTYPNVGVRNSVLWQELYLKFGKMLVVASPLCRDLFDYKLLLKDWLQSGLAWRGRRRAITCTNWDYYDHCGSLLNKILFEHSSFKPPWSTSYILSKPLSAELALTRPLIFVLISVIFVLWTSEVMRVFSAVLTFFVFLSIPHFVFVLLFASSTAPEALRPLGRSARWWPRLVYCPRTINAFSDCYHRWRIVRRVSYVLIIKRPSSRGWPMPLVWMITFIVVTLLESTCLTVKKNHGVFLEMVFFCKKETAKAGISLWAVDRIWLLWDDGSYCSRYILFLVPTLKATTCTLFITFAVN